MYKCKYNGKSKTLMVLEDLKGKSVAKICTSTNINGTYPGIRLAQAIELISI